MFRRTVAGVTTLVTRLSHGSASDISAINAGLMAKQCCLQTAEFRRLIDCTLTEDQWVALIRQRCVGGRNPFTGR